MCSCTTLEGRRRQIGRFGLQGNLNIYKCNAATPRAATQTGFSLGPFGPCRDPPSLCPPRLHLRGGWRGVCGITIIAATPLPALFLSSVFMLDPSHSRPAECLIVSETLRRSRCNELPIIHAPDLRTCVNTYPPHPHRTPAPIFDGLSKARRHTTTQSWLPPPPFNIHKVRCSVSHHLPIYTPLSTAHSE